MHRGSNNMRPNLSHLPFPYAQLSKVWETDLQLLDGLCAGNVIFSVTRLALLLYPAHGEGSIGIVVG